MCRLTTLLVVSLLLLSGCSAGKLLERDRPEAAFEKAVKRLERKPGGSDGLIDVASAAYAQLQAETRQELAATTGSALDAYGERAVGLLEVLLARRERVHQLRLRLRRVAQFPEWDAEPDYAAELTKAKAYAAERLLAGARDGLLLAQGGDRFAAREAYGLLDRRTRYAATTSEAESLQASLLDLGTLRIIAEVAHEGAAYGVDFESALVEQLSREWIEVVPAGRRPDNWADLFATVYLATPSGIDVQEATTTDVYEKDITTKTLVGEDTSGVAIYETVVERVKAEVQTRARTYTTSAGATVELYDAGDLRLATYTYAGRAVAQRQRVDVRGDQRALANICLPSSTIGDVDRVDERSLLRAAHRDLARRMGRIDADRAFGDRMLASTK